VITSNANPTNFKRLNLFKPLNAPQADEEEAKLEQKAQILKKNN
jgi:hypothetical protein